jgi:hypothetical protein
MGEEQGAVSPSVTDPEQEPDPEQLRAETDETPKDVGETVAAPAANTDFKARATARADKVRQTVADKRAQVAGGRDGAPTARPGPAAHVRAKTHKNAVPAAAIAAFAGGLILGRLTKHG